MTANGFAEEIASLGQWEFNADPCGPENAASLIIEVLRRYLEENARKNAIRGATTVLEYLRDEHMFFLNFGEEPTVTVHLTDNAEMEVSLGKLIDDDAEWGHYKEHLERAAVWLRAQADKLDAAAQDAEAETDPHAQSSASNAPGNTASPNPA